MDSKYNCPHHGVVYSEWEHYKYHQDFECELWLTKQNVCTIMDDEGEKACGKSFKETASLILHIFKHHDLYACTCCYETFATAKELESHEHPIGLDVRKRKYLHFSEVQCV